MAGVLTTLSTKGTGFFFWLWFGFFGVDMVRHLHETCDMCSCIGTWTFRSSLVSVGPGGVPSRDGRRRFGVDRVRPRLPLGFHKQVQLVW